MTLGVVIAGGRIVGATIAAELRVSGAGRGVGDWEEPR